MPKKPVSRQQLELFDSIPGPERSPSTQPEPAPDSSEEPLPDRRTATPTPQPERPLPRGDDKTLTQLCRELADGLMLPKLASFVKVRWNLRLRTTAGRAYRDKLLIELNPMLVRVSDEEVDRTMRHELAHLVAYARAGTRRIQPHGPEWRQACADLGIPGEDRCHDLPFDRIQQKRRYVYECPNCTHQIFRVRPIQRAAACYDCCRKYSAGRYDTRFELVERRL